jgi:serine/threonine protein kinase
MSDEPQRQRTATRLRAEAPPGMQVGVDGLAAIGRYEIVKQLGKGAMGVVYKARDPLLDRVVAVKTISSPQGSGRRVRAAFLERFQREAKAAAKMQHPAIVTIFDVGVDEESGAPYMVLEYLPGESLADRLDKVRFPLFRAVNAALDLASALAFAHKQRIVHRDVKPANVLHAGENRWKLADFGIARMPDSDLTQVGIFMGTPGYSPPEAIKEGRYTAQADVFAWGAVLYELVSGRIPYEGPDTKTTNGFVIAGAALPPSKHDPSIPAPIEEVIMHALQSGADKRYRDGEELEAALREAWDRCLTQGIVHPSVLAMNELPHEKAPPQMHGPKMSVLPGAAPVSVSSNAKSFDSGATVPQHFDHDNEKTTVLLRDDIRIPVKVSVVAARESQPQVTGAKHAMADNPRLPPHQAPQVEELPTPLINALESADPSEAGPLWTEPSERLGVGRGDRVITDPFAAPLTQDAVRGKSSTPWLRWQTIVLAIILLAMATVVALHYLHIFEIPGLSI